MGHHRKGMMMGKWQGKMVPYKGVATVSTSLNGILGRHHTLISLLAQINPPFRSTLVPFCVIALHKILKLLCPLNCKPPEGKKSHNFFSTGKSQLSFWASVNKCPRLSMLYVVSDAQKKKKCMIFFMDVKPLLA